MAMNLEGPFLLRLLFHAFVVLAGVLILSGAAILLVLGGAALMLRQQFKPLLASFGVVVLAAFALHASARTSHPLSGAELIFPPRAQADVAASVAEISTFARHAGAGKDLFVAIDPAVQQPFHWYLRQFTRMTVGGQLPDGPSVKVAPLQNATGEMTAEGYVARVSQVMPYQPSGLIDYWRWLLYGETKTPPVWVQAVLQFNE